MIDLNDFDIDQNYKGTLERSMTMRRGWFPGRESRPAPENVVRFVATFLERLSSKTDNLPILGISTTGGFVLTYPESADFIDYDDTWKWWMDVENNGKVSIGIYYISNMEDEYNINKEDPDDVIEYILDALERYEFFE